METTQDPELLFLQSVKSPHTKKMYQFALEKYLDFCKLEDYPDLLKGEKKEIEDRFHSFVLHLNGDSYSNSMRNICFSGVRKFYIANRRGDLDFLWLASFKQIRDEYREDNAYTKEQIEKMLEAAGDDRARAILLIFATSGIRLEALATLKIGHIKYLQTDSLIALTPYAGSKDKYVTFVTPQGTKYLVRYLKERYGRASNLPPEAPLISNTFYPDLPSSADSIGSQVRDLAIKAEIRLEHGDPAERKQTMRVHGLRKFFGTTMANVDSIKREHRERLLGHITSLDKSYIKLDIPALLPEYRKAIKDLTFNFGNPMVQKVDPPITTA